MATSAKRMLITEFPFLKDECEAMLDKYPNGTSGYRFIYVVLLDFYTAERDNQKCIETCESLGTVFDPIRENYWLFRKQKYEVLKPLAG